MVSLTSRRTVLVVDDHPVVREGVRSLLEREWEFEVIAEASSHAEALTALESKVPDVAIVDIALHGNDGLELTKTIRSHYAQLPVLVVSMHDEALYAERALNAGASGYVMKDVMSDTVVTAVRKVLEGDIYVSEQIIQRMFRDFASAGTRPADSPVSTLSDRELEVLRHIGEGMGTRQIAETLNLSVKTIETYRAHIKEKLGLANANELVRYGVKWLDDQVSE